MSNLKVGDKVQLIKDSEGFEMGQVVEVFRLYANGGHLFKGDNSEYRHCNGQEGAWLSPSDYIVLPSTTAHPHADLLLKYAMIAQYDGKPWECFEFLNRCNQWVPFRMDIDWSGYRGYRLKPQPLLVQVGQTWVSPEGITVQVQAVLSGSSTVKFSYLVGGVNQVQIMNTNVFSKVFKRKE